jgi:hypothetical protein
MSDDLFDWATERDYGRPAESETGDGDVEKMLALLHMNREPMLASALYRLLGWSDRHCRQAASESMGRILSTDDGYLPTVRATPDQFRAANGRIYSQARKMLARALRERKVWHAAAHRS